MNQWLAQIFYAQLEISLSINIFMIIFFYLVFYYINRLLFNDVLDKNDN
jgi:hypothetical protein